MSDPRPSKSTEKGWERAKSGVCCPSSMAERDMSDKTVLITGGNAGIGKLTAVGLAKRGARVVFTSRNPRKGDVACAEIREAAETQKVDSLVLDLSSFASIESCAKEFLAKYPRLDVLILNAGLVLQERSETKEGFESTFGVNHLGHFYLTELLRERLEASAPSRVIVLASDAHKGARDGLDFDDLMAERGYSGFLVYSRSKLANILYANELARQLEGKGVTANSVHPGVVRTRFGLDGDTGGFSGAVYRMMRPFMIGPERGARTSIHLAVASELEGKTGGYYAKCREAKRTSAAQDAAAAKRLWEVSEKLVAEAKASR